MYHFTDHLYLFTKHQQLLQIIPTVSTSPVLFYGGSIALQIILTVSRSPVPFNGASIAFTDHSYRLQGTCTFLRTIHSCYRSFLSSPSHLYLLTNHLQLLQIIPIVSRSPVAFTNHPQLLQIIPIVPRSLIPFYGPSIAFTDHSYPHQITCTFLRSINSFYRSFLPFLLHLYYFMEDPQLYRSFLPFPGHLYHLTEHPQLLQIIPIVSRAPVPFYGPSIAVTDHSYRLQVTCTFLRTIHSFYRSFLSSPSHLYLLTNHLQLLQIIPIVSRSPVAFTNHPQLLQIIPIVPRSLIPFYGPSIAFTDHSYPHQITCTFLRSIHSIYRSFLPSPDQLYHFINHLYLFTKHQQLLQIIPTVSSSPVLFYGGSIAFIDHSYSFQVTCII